MEKYYKASDIGALIEKLLRTPYYSHEGESWYSGVSAVWDAITEVPAEEADINELRRRVADLNNRRHLIWALGVDYDGCNTVESLKGLIDELVAYTQLPEDQIPDITSRTGKWIQKEHVINEYGDTESSFVCSSCQTEYKCREYTPKSFIEHHEFCPHCGAKMRSDE